ncbi:phage integrase SAM-like domain-containing protein [Christiangramia echinicola]|uniref:phage integrase SAM-like domain-containing protein n=1 Tax=Christiangramia echinicola TaxID=279359 RepID=UPI0004021F3B|nr:phage integrase SAM-like domain-containing protein [Christiangramia echinicola]
MEITVKTRSADKEHFYIYINVHDGGKYPLSRTTVKRAKIKKKNWNPNHSDNKKNWVKTTEPNYKKINEQIHKLKVQLEAELLGLTPNELTLKKESKITGGHLNFFKYGYKRKDQRFNNITKNNDVAGLNKFQEFLESKEMHSITFKDITHTLVKDYQTWLRKSLEESTTNTYINRIKAVYNDALQNPDCSFKEPQTHPFKYIKRLKEKFKNTYLSQDEFHRFKILNVYNMKIKGARKDTHDRYNHTQRAWLFQFWGAFRFMDVVMLKWGDLIYNDKGVGMDVYTSKSETRLLRMFPMSLMELLIKQLPNNNEFIPLKVKQLDKDIKHYQIQIDRTPDTHNKIEDIPNGVLIEILDSGRTIKDIQKDNNKKLRLIEKRDSLIQQRMGYLSYQIQVAIKKYPDVYVWDFGNNAKLGPDNKRWDEAETKRYNSISSNNAATLKKIQKLAKIDTNITSHVARHTASQMLFENGATTHATSEYLTHASLGTTEKYRRRSGHFDSQISDFLGNMLF